MNPKKGHSLDTNCRPSWTDASDGNRLCPNWPLTIEMRPETGSHLRYLVLSSDLKMFMNFRKQRLALTICGVFGAGILVGQTAAFSQPVGDPPTVSNACLKAEERANQLMEYYGANSSSGKAWFDAAHFCSQSFRGEMRTLYKQLTQRCDKAYQGRDGTMYYAFHGLCYFNAYEYVNWLVMEF